MGYSAGDALTAQWGRNIKRLRRERELNQEELARLVRVHPTNFSRFETGKQRPTDEVRIRIAQALGVRVEDIFVYDEVAS